MTYKMYSDGCHLKEFKVAGAGAYLTKNDETIFEISEVIENKSYHALHERFALKIALEKALELKLEKEKIEIYSDDQGLMKILSLKNRRNYYDEGNLLKELCDLCDKFEQLSFSYIPRNENERADKLSRKSLEENVFKENKIVEGGLNHPKWITKNNYSQFSKNQLLQERNSINNYLVFHYFHNKENNTVQIEVFSARREKNQDIENVVYKKIEDIQTPYKNWEAFCLDNIAKHLGNIEKEQGVGLVVHDNYIVLDQLLRGRKAFTKKMKNAYNNLINAVEKLEKVVVHREPIVYETIFNDDPKHMKSKVLLK